MPQKRFVISDEIIDEMENDPNFAIGMPREMVQNEIR